MKELSVKNIIEFTGKSDRSKKTFVQKLKQEKEQKELDGGGDYWISCLSAISNSFKNNNLQFIKEKVYELEEKFENTDYNQTKTMYGRNIDILYKYEIFDFNIWRPDEKITFIKKHKLDLIIPVNGFQIQANPHHVFSFHSNETKEIGAIWFIAQLDGYKKNELGMFSEVLFRYLNKTYSDDYLVNPRYCIAVDVVNNFNVNYSQLQEGEVPFLLDKIIDEIKKIV